MTRAERAFDAVSLYVIIAIILVIGGVIWVAWRSEDAARSACLARGGTWACQSLPGGGPIIVIGNNPGIGIRTDAETCACETPTDPRPGEPK